MPQQTKIFRVFVSSTFSDMKTERKLLQEKVFPELEKFCRQNGARFQAIDLRWGVSEDSQRDQKTMEICLNEIRRCQQITPKPNFLILLGDRYGWQPVPAKIPQTEMDLLFPSFSSEVQKLVNDWYKLDTNAIPAEYVLQPRKGAFSEYGKWKPIETDLRENLRTAALKANFDNGALIKFTTSATHQEIIAGALNPSYGTAEPEEHVFVLSRQINNLPEDKSAADFIDLSENGMRDEYCKMQLESLREVLAKKLGDNFIPYSVNWNGGKELFCEQDGFDEKIFIEGNIKRLKVIIEDQLKTLVDEDELQMEIRYHQEFAASLTEHFTGRDSTLQEIHAYLDDKHNNKVLALIGASGSGKTSVMARAIELAASENTSFVVRFIGANAKSSNLISFLSSICMQIAQSYGKTLLELAEDFQKQKLFDYYTLIMIFQKCLALASPDRRILLFLDALDQLSDSDDAKSLNWLPKILPAHVHLVVSVLPELESQLHDAQIIHLLPMPQTEGESLLNAWLENSSRQLTSDQKNEVLDKFQEHGLPLFLRITFEHVRHWHSNDPVVPLPSTILGIISQFMRALEDLHYPLLVSKVIGYILSGRDQGLTEDEILDMMVFDDEHWQYFLQDICHPKHRQEVEDAKKLPVVVWSRLFLDLSPYLTERDSYGERIITFYHNQFKKTLKNKYLTNEKLFHVKLGKYFCRQTDFLDDIDENKPNNRKSVEHLYQQTRGEMWCEAAATMCNFNSILAKCKLGFFPLLLEDSQQITAVFPVNHPDYDSLITIKSCIMLSAQIISHDFVQLPSQLIGRMGHLRGLNIERLLIGARNWKGAPWILPSNYNLTPAGGSLIATLRKHSESVHSLSLSSDGKRLLSGGWDNNVVLWDLNKSREVAVLEGHQNKVNSVIITPDGQRAISGSWDKTIKIWDLNTRSDIITLRGHSDGIRTLTVSPDFKYLISGSFDHTIKVWNLENNSELTTLSGHEGIILSTAVSKDGKYLISGSSDRSIKIWSMVDFKLIATLYGHDGSVIALDFSLDNSKIVSGSFDSNIIIWDFVSKRIDKSLVGHMGPVSAVAVMRENNRMVSASYDSTLKIWDIDKGIELATLSGHDSFVTSIVLSREEGHIISGSNDRTIKIWNINDQPRLTSSEKAYSRITAMAVSPDGKFLITGNVDNNITVWNARDFTRCLSINGHKGRINCLSVTRDSHYLFSGADDMTIKVWELCTGNELISTKTHNGPIYAIAFGSIEKLIFSCTKLGELKIWDFKDFKDFKELATFETHNSSNRSIALIDNDRKVVFIDNIILRLFDLSCGFETMIFEGHTSAINCALVIPATQTIISGSEDGMIKIWNVNQSPTISILPWHNDCGLPVKGEVASLKGHEGAVRSMSYSVTNHYLVSCSVDGSIKIWDLDKCACIATINFDNVVNHCSWVQNNCMAAAEFSGRIHFLELKMPSNIAE